VDVFGTRCSYGNLPHCTTTVFAKRTVGPILNQLSVFRSRERNVFDSLQPLTSAYDVESLTFEPDQYQAAASNVKCHGDEKRGGVILMSVNENNISIIGKF